MERKARVSHNFNKMNPLQQVFLGNQVIEKLGERPDLFGNLPVSLADLTATNMKLQETYNTYKIFNKSYREAFLAAREVWLEKFRVTASAVNTIANGSGSVIELSGFYLSKTETSRSKEPVVPVSPAIEYRRAKGALNVEVKKVEDAMGYIFTAAPAGVIIEKRHNQISVQVGDAFFSIVIGTQKAIEFIGLPSKADVRIGVAAFNRAGLSGIWKSGEIGMP